MGDNIQLEQLAELVKHLPIKLRSKGSIAALEAAVKQNYISVKEDHTLQWEAECKTLLAYFCGKAWSGDYSRYSRTCGKTIWKTGNIPFPSSEIDRLFNTNSLKQIRNNRKNTALPYRWQLIDELFDKRNRVNKW